MKKSLLICAVFVFTLTVNLKSQTKEDSVAIKQAILNYIEGWYAGDVERMDKALHPDLTKRQPVTLPSGEIITNQITKNTMLAYTKMGAGKQQADGNIKNKVKILNIYENIATAMALSKDYMDYCHLSLYNGEWKIINVLWVRNKDAKKGQQ